MQVILLERIEKLGQMGDVVTVRPGFARNFLLPQKKALRAKATKMVALAGKLAEEKGIDDSVTIVVDAKEGTIRSYDLNAAKRMITHATNNARCASVRAVHC